MNARQHLEGLVGQVLRTMTRNEPNTILRLDDENAIVATSRTPEGTQIPIAWVQEAMDRLTAAGQLEVTTDSLGSPIGHRSAFLGAVLRELDGVDVLLNPPRVRAHHVGGPSTWTVRPGQSIKRTELHAIYGGGRQGGIAPSARSPNVLIFSDAERGQRHGYVDGWQEDGCFHYTGEGQTGDQPLTHGNKMIAQHEQDGRALRVFDGVAGTVTYVGEFRLDQTPYRTDAPESEDAPSQGRVIRQVLVFALRPVDITARSPGPSPRTVLGGPVLVEVQVEQQNTERAFVNPSGETYEVERREQRLVLAYQDFLRVKGRAAVRNRIRPPGEAKPLFSDIYDKPRNNVIEAKGSGSRSNIRMAIGQLADYGRFLDPPPSRGVLLPDRPRRDLEALLRSEGIAAVWRTPEGFEDNADGQFT